MKTFYETVINRSDSNVLKPFHDINFRQKILRASPLVYRSADLRKLRGTKQLREQFQPVVHGVYAEARDLNSIAMARVAYRRASKGIVGGWAGLNYWNVGYFFEQLATTIHEPGRERRRIGEHIRVLDHQPTAFAGLDPAYPGLLVADPATCVVDCLQDIACRRATWWVDRVEGLDFESVRAIQVIDAAMRFAEVTPEQLRAAARNRYCARKLNRLLDRCRWGAESPYETTTRLILEPVAPGVVLQREHYLMDRPSFGRLVTISDLCWEEFRLAVFYDGASHLEPTIWDIDAEKVAILQSQGWRVLRVNRAMLRDPHELRRRVLILLRQGGFKG
ncbi:DUF559 domain-containing protein [Staphylococcus chromogenes]|nr:DUF559 domain-containing protein [Staphylococcus chromogenes]